MFLGERKESVPFGREPFPVTLGLQEQLGTTTIATATTTTTTTTHH